MRIEEDVKLDYKDVLIRPKRSTLKSRSYIMKEQGQQIEKTKPDQVDTDNNSGYIQNQEQNSNTIWNRLNRD